MIHLVFINLRNANINTYQASETGDVFYTRLLLLDVGSQFINEASVLENC